MARPLS